MKLPGEGLARRPLHFIWLCDCSGSMSVEGKIQALNNAIREALPHMQTVADENPNANVLVRAVKFSDGAQWHVGTPTEIKGFRWEDLTADGETKLGKALSIVAEQMKMPPMDERGLPPVLVLISDGQPTDDFNAGLADLMAEGWGKRAVRIAIALGSDADHEVLQKFIGNSEIKPLQANNADALTKYIKWASTAVLKSASQPPTVQTDSDSPPSSSVPIPTAPPISPEDEDGVW